MPRDDDDTPIMSKLDRLWHIVTGNGDPREGLVYKVDLMRETLERQEKQSQEVRALAGKVLVGVVVAVLLAVGNMLINLSHK